MSYDFDGTDDYIQLGGATTYAPPLTLSCWFNPDVVPASGIRTLISLSEATVGGSSGTTLNHSVLLLINSSQTLVARAAVNNGNSSSLSTNTWSTGTWSHALGRFTSASNRIACLDGVIGTNSGASRAATNLDNLLMGRASGGTYAGNNPFNGKLAEVAVWAATLADDEVVALSKGAKASSIRPGDLVYYQPLVRESSDVMSSEPVTVSGPLVFQHPRRYG
jgi:hypothetical protein